MKTFLPPPRKKSYNSKINSTLRHLQLFTPFLFLFMFSSYSIKAQNSSFNPNNKWHLIGPDGKTGVNYNYTGEIHYVYFPNPENRNTVFVCSPTGGLFKTIDGGTSLQTGNNKQGC